MSATGAPQLSTSDELIEAGFFPTVPIAYTDKDAILYALGVGATERKYVYEKDSHFAVLPTLIFATTFKGVESARTLPFPPPQLLMDLDVFKGKVIVDAERSMEVIRGPLPVSVSLDDQWGMKTRFTAVTPKKAGLLVETETVIVDELAGDEVIRLTNSVFFLGKSDLIPAGVPTTTKITVPERSPDYTRVEHTSPHQADLYRLSGDYNPLHVDPVAAQSYGFDQPILHGLCTLGFAARHVIDACLEGDEKRLRSFRCRFTKPVIPGDRLRTEIWKDGRGVLFRTWAERCTEGKTTPAEPVVVLDSGVAQFFE